MKERKRGKEKKTEGEERIHEIKAIQIANHNFPVKAEITGRKY